MQERPHEAPAQEETWTPIGDEYRIRTSSLVIDLVEAEGDLRIRLSPRRPGLVVVEPSVEVRGSDFLIVCGTVGR